jgi:hypothetical protein
MAIGDIGNRAGSLIMSHDFMDILQSIVDI